MRASVPPQLEAARLNLNIPGFRTTARDGFNGAFQLMGPKGGSLRIIASAACKESEGWEHVSVSLEHRTPNWAEMCFVKGLFWEPEECVIQFHPPESQYISNHPFCLHLWRKQGFEFPMPPAIMVGVKTEGELRGPDHARSVYNRMQRGEFDK